MDHTQLLERPSFLGHTTRSRIVHIVVLALLLLMPLGAYFSGHEFWLDLATRLLALTIAAVTLNFVLGFGGMVSFGHAAFIGIGAYCVGIPGYYESYSGLLHFPLAIFCGALFALITGAISLRTKGVHFIMITMAFAQMIFYGIVALEEYGGDDGLTIDIRSELPLIDLENALTLFILTYVSLIVILYISYRLVHSRFGLVLQGAKGNEERMSAIGINTYSYKLTAYVIAGAMGGYAGALLGNFTGFISPEMMDWTRSGELIFMVILGGSGTLFGPVMGAAMFLGLEELMSGWTIYWHLPFGIMLILVVLFIRGGVGSLLAGRR